MIDIRKAQIAAGKVDARFASLERVDWKKIYGTEQELIDDLLNVYVPRDHEWPSAAYSLFKGYEYVHSFARRVQSGQDLTEAQMRQAKRLAKEIKKAVVVSEYC